VDGFVSATSYKPRKRATVLLNTVAPMAPKKRSGTKKYDDEVKIALTEG
jgi:hypothetical protein